MIAVIVMMLLTSGLYLSLQKHFHKLYCGDVAEAEALKRRLQRMVFENESLEAGNNRLKNNLEQTVQLYDITKEITKFLEADKVCSSFRDQMNRYLKLKDCRFIQGEAELKDHKDSLVLPLHIAKRSFGYLVADGVKEEDLEKFHILAGQFLLGIKRAFLYQKVQEMATTDSLTGVFTRRYWAERGAEEIARSKKFGYRICCLMIDMDHFKEFNDRYGHLVGDALLVEAANTIKENIRQIDLLGKYGGEEFCIILTETDLDSAKFVAERIRQATETKTVSVYDESLKITISIGISAFPDNAEDLNGLIDKADSALYKAKGQGRNRVCVYS